MFLKQSTNPQYVLIGPFLDDTDGKTAETGLSIGVSDIRLGKAGGNIVAKNSGGATHDELGFYQITLDATDTATVGELLIAVHKSGALPVFKYCYVLEEAIYDAMFAASADLITKVDAIDTVVDSILVDTGTTLDGKIDTIDGIVDAILVDTGTTLDGKINTIDGIVDNILVDTAEIGSAGAGLTAVPWNSNWDAEVQSECNDALVALGLDHLVSASVAGSDVADNSIVAKLVSKESTADWDDYVNTTESLQALRDRGDAAWTTGGGGSAPTVAEIRAEMDSNSTQLAAIVADTNELQTDWANGGRLDLLLDATLADTNELQTDWANGGRLDLIIDAILVDTAEIGSAGAGLTAVPWNASWDAEVQSECTDALNAYDPPTKAEMDGMWTTAQTESYASDGAAATPAQLLYMILCSVSEFAISGTTITGKKLDGSTTAMTWTISDSSNPTSRTRAS